MKELRSPQPRRVVTARTVAEARRELVKQIDSDTLTDVGTTSVERETSFNE